MNEDEKRKEERKKKILSSRWIITGVGVIAIFYFLFLQKSMHKPGRRCSIARVGSCSWVSNEEGGVWINTNCPYSLSVCMHELQFRRGTHPHEHGSVSLSVLLRDSIHHVCVCIQYVCLCIYIYVYCFLVTSMCDVMYEHTRGFAQLEPLHARSFPRQSASDYRSGSTTAAGPVTGWIHLLDNINRSLSMRYHRVFANCRIFCLVCCAEFVLRWRQCIRVALS